MQGFRAVLPEILAHEQSLLALKTLAFKAFGFVQYALIIYNAVNALFSCLDRLLCSLQSLSARQIRYMIIVASGGELR